MALRTEYRDGPMLTVSGAGCENIGVREIEVEVERKEMVRGVWPSMDSKTTVLKAA